MNLNCYKTILYNLGNTNAIPNENFLTYIQKKTKISVCCTIFKNFRIS